MTQTARSVSAPTIAVTLGYDLPRNPGQLGVRGAILETLAVQGPASGSSRPGRPPLDDAFFAPGGRAWCSPADQTLIPRGGASPCIPRR